VPYDLATNESHSRVLLGFDRAQHSIAMEGWYWNALDWLDAETEWKTGDLVQVAWIAAINAIRNRTTTNPGNFLADFTLALKYGIQSKVDELDRPDEPLDEAPETPVGDSPSPPSGDQRYDARQVELASWSPDTRLVTLTMPIETLGSIMAILGTVAATWSLQDATAIGHSFERVRDLSDQLEAVVNVVPD